MLTAAEKILANISCSENELRSVTQIPNLFLRRKVACFPWKDEFLFIADYRQLMPPALEGTAFDLSNGGYALLAPCTAGNLNILKNFFSCLQPHIPHSEMSWERFETGKIPVFHAQTPADQEQIIKKVFQKGWNHGFAIASQQLSGDHIVPLLTANPTTETANEDLPARYRDHVFVLDSAAVRFSGKQAERCSSLYAGVLHYLTNSRKFSLLQLPNQAEVQDLLFINRELLLANAKLPAVLLPPGKSLQHFTAVNASYGKIFLLSR